MFDVKKAERLLNKELKDVKVKLINPTDEMKDFEKLKSFGAEVEVIEEGEPAIVVSKGDVEIVYKATPAQMEFEPFARTLLRLAENEVDENLKLEGCRGEIKVFIAPVCPHCAQVVESVNRIAIANPEIKVTVIDVMLYPDLIEKYEITSTPTVIIGDVKLIGEHSLEELLDWTEKALCGKDYRVDYYVKLLEDGRIDEVKQAVENEENLMLLADILERQELLARAGAMMILEELFRKNPEKLTGVKQRILKILEKDNPVALQDAAYILGKIGNRDDVPHLKKLLNSNDEDVRDAAEEAIEEIEEREKLG